MTMFSDGMLLGVGTGAAPLTFVSSTGAGSGAAANLSINKPSGAASGDTAYVIVWYIGSTPTIAGFVDEGGVATTFYKFRVFSRTIDGSEGSSFTIVDATNGKNAICLLYRGGTGAVDIIGTKSETSSATSNAPSINRGNAGVLLAGFMNGSGWSVTTPPSGMTQRVINTAWLVVTVYDLNPSPTGASGTKTLVWSASADVMAFQLQIY